jgi:hypothetical protein
MMNLSGKRKSINAQALRFLIRPTICSQRRRFGFRAPAALQYLSLATARLHEASIRLLDNAPGAKVSS